MHRWNFSILATAALLSVGLHATDAKIKKAKRGLLANDPNKSLRELSDITRERGIRLFVAVNPRKDQSNDIQKLWILRKRRDIKLITLYDELMKTIRDQNIEPRSMILPRDPHPSAIKHKVLGDLLTPYFMYAIR